MSPRSGFGVLLLVVANVSVQLLPFTSVCACRPSLYTITVCHLRVIVKKHAFCPTDCGGWWLVFG